MITARPPPLARQAAQVQRLVPRQLPARYHPSQRELYDPTTISPLTHRNILTFSSKRIACDDASTYFKSVAWAGADGGSGFNADFGMAAKSEEDCCAACRDADKSCAGWVFEANNTFTPCTRLLLKDNNPNKDDKCPQGRVASTTFQDGGEMVAGLGPCSGKAIG